MTGFQMTPVVDPSKGDLGTCRSCGATVYWRVTSAGKRAPYNPDGISHFATCPQAQTWRKR